MKRTETKVKKADKRILYFFNEWGVPLGSLQWGCKPPKLHLHNSVQSVHMFIYNIKQSANLFIYNIKQNTVMHKKKES